MPQIDLPAKGPKYPQYALPARRKDSFNQWPGYLPLRPETLVEAGLVYTGVGDSVRCYHCGGGLRSWEEGDNPWVEHARWYPWCQHVIQVKGQSFIDAVARGENPLDQSDKVANDHTSSNIARQSCIEMGFSETVVKMAADLFKARNGHCDYRATDLFEIILEIQETEDIQMLTGAAENSAQAAGSTGDTSADVHTAHMDDAALFGATGGTTVENGDLDDKTTRSIDLQKLQEENQRLRDASQCKLCMDAIVNTVFLPCGHMTFCAKCASTVRLCPICNMPIKGRVKILPS